LVYSIPHIAVSTAEGVIQRMIEGIQRMIRVNNNNNYSREEESEIIRINPAMKRHYELEIETLQNAPRDEDKLRELLKLKEKQNEEATHIEDTQRLVTEIEMLKFVLFLVCRNETT
jgi:methyl coenzyme M reductase beta subunit